MVPFQLLIIISSPSSSPYEQDPSPIPFSPFSNSSNNLKLRGTSRCQLIFPILIPVNSLFAIDVQGERRDGDNSLSVTRLSPYRSLSTTPCSEAGNQIPMMILSVGEAFESVGAQLTDLCTAKTTDENLTGENWELIITLCDKVQDEGENGYVALEQI
jgi:hypothetical protein